MLEAFIMEFQLNKIDTNIRSLQDLVDMLKADCLFRNEFERFFNSLRASGKIDNKRAFPNTADSSGEHCHRRNFKAFLPYGFTYAGRLLFNDGKSRFGSNVSRGKARAAGC